jgi:hypothetical protein
MNRSRNRALRSPQNDETMLGGTTGAGNPALTDPSPTPLTCGLKRSHTFRAKSEMGLPPNRGGLLIDG